MGTRRKRSLPLVFSILDRASGSAPPTADAARKKLGGRARSEPGVGRLVAIDVSGRRVRGVLLFASQSECDVLTEEGTVRRARADRVEAYGGPIADETRRIANDAQVFGTLSEGERVRFESREGVMIEGALVEKCRYGGLVLTGEGKLVAVGFRKLWPVSKDSVS